MLGLNLTLTQQAPALLISGRPRNQVHAVHMASNLYRRARGQVWLSRVWSVLCGRSCRLLSLATVEATCRIRPSHQAGAHTVPIHQIRGSENRCHDFDSAFLPLRSHNRQRWPNIAAARQLGVMLPAVELIQVGDVYFVRDGHHRISVAQALGQEYIDAVVMIWQVAGVLPWETSARVRTLVRRSA